MPGDRVAGRGRTNVDKNARLTVRRVLGEGQAWKAVAMAFGVNATTVSQWVAQFRFDAPAERP